MHVIMEKSYYWLTILTTTNVWFEHFPQRLKCNKTKENHFCSCDHTQCLKTWGSKGWQTVEYVWERAGHMSTYLGPASSCNYDAWSANRWAVLERDGLRSLNWALMDLDFSFIWSCITSSQQQAQLHLWSFSLSLVHSLGEEIFL